MKGIDLETVSPTVLFSKTSGSYANVYKGSFYQVLSENSVRRASRDTSLVREVYVHRNTEEILTRTSIVCRRMYALLHRSHLRFNSREERATHTRQKSLVPLSPNAHLLA